MQSFVRRVAAASKLMPPTNKSLALIDLCALRMGATLRNCVGLLPESKLTNRRCKRRHLAA